MKKASGIFPGPCERGYLMDMVQFSPLGGSSRYDQYFSTERAASVMDFHRTLPAYAPTPLSCLKGLTSRLGLGGLYVKDESFRFGLNAFKGLGGSYALAQVLSRKTGSPVSGLHSVPAGTYTFVTATDGNHGRGVAWAARQLAQRAVVYMPAGSAQERLENIRAQGAQAEITEFCYDDTVRFAKSQAEKNGWILVQDTAWPGYEEIPLLIMQGYLTMGLEAVHQLKGTVPTHIFLQAGVGSMAAAIASFFCQQYAGQTPKIIIMEPESADCFYRTAKTKDGCLHNAEGPMRSIMAGLCCGEPCTLAWDILEHHAGYFFACGDETAACGMRVLGNPMEGDPRIISGESGASTTGLIYELMSRPSLAGLREAIGLGRDSVVLCISTEGDTDRENYRRIVWDGAYAAVKS